MEHHPRRRAARDDLVDDPVEDELPVGEVAAEVLAQNEERGRQSPGTTISDRWSWPRDSGSRATTTGP